ALGVQWVRSFGAEQVDLISGLYRSPDLMGWHAAALAMFTLTLLTERRRGTVIWLLMAGAGVLATIMAGRRKMMIMPLIWAAVILLTYMRAGRVGRAVSLIAF